jgi:hypothetical protein
MSMLFGSPKAPTPPPPPPAAPQLGQASIMEQAASERETLASADGGGMTGTDVTGGQGAKSPSTTKSLLGG